MPAACASSSAQQSCLPLLTLSEISWLQVVSKLHSILKPFLLRRVKTDVETSLPAKMEVLLYAPMAPAQQKLNEVLLQRTMKVRTPPLPRLNHNDTFMCRWSPVLVRRRCSSAAAQVSGGMMRAGPVARWWSLHHQP